MVETGWLAPVCVNTHRAPYMHMVVEEPLYTASQQVRPCVIIENVGRRKDAEREKCVSVCVCIYIYIYIYIYTTYTYKNIYDLVSSQGERRKGRQKKKYTTSDIGETTLFREKRNPKWAEKEKILRSLLDAVAFILFNYFLLRSFFCFFFV